MSKRRNKQERWRRILQEQRASGLSVTAFCRQAYLTQLLAGLQDTPVSQLEQWLPDRWKAAQD